MPSGWGIHVNIVAEPGTTEPVAVLAGTESGLTESWVRMQAATSFHG